MLHVQHETMIDIAIKTREVAETVKAEQAQLTARADELLGSGWTGPAAKGFGAGFAEWRDGAAKVIHALDAMGSLIGSANHTFAATAAVRSEAVKAAASGLGASAGQTAQASPAPQAGFVATEPFAGTTRLNL